MTNLKKVDRSLAEQGRWKAYRAANRLIVGAGIILAESGVESQAPEIKALAAALRTLNRAGAIIGSTSDPGPDREPIAAPPRADAQRYRRAAP